ncbi:hypothetical protein DFP73DRAFT_613519 [Morchella snyderi]|nr:hypothetical protein DFP73DRAFT_613519 [Morchella snyderi]
MARHGTGPRSSQPIPAPMCNGKGVLSKLPTADPSKVSHKKNDETLGLRDEYLVTEDEYTGAESTSSDTAASEDDNDTAHVNDSDVTGDENVVSEDEVPGTECSGSEIATSEDGSDNDVDNDSDVPTPPPAPTPKRTRKPTASRATKKKALKKGAKGMTKGARTPKRIRTEPVLSSDEGGDLEDSAEEEAPDNCTKVRRRRVGAATEVVPLSAADFTSIFIDGYVFDVPANPVECYHKVRQEVIASYRAVVARRGTERDMALVVGSGTETRVGKTHGWVNGRGVGGRGGRKRQAQGGKGGDLEEGKRLKKRRTRVEKRVKEGVAGEIDAAEGRCKGKGREESVML